MLGSKTSDVVVCCEFRTDFVNELLVCMGCTAEKVSCSGEESSCCFGAGNTIRMRSPGSGQWRKDNCLMDNVH